MIQKLRIIRLLVAMLIALSCFSLTVAAQLPMSGSAPAAGKSGSSEIRQIGQGELTRPQIRELMSRLSDDDVRSLLLEQLDKSAAAESQKGETGFIDQIETKGEIIRDRLVQVLGAASQTPGTIAKVISRLQEAGGLDKALLALAVILGVSLGANWLWRRYARRVKDRMIVRNAQVVRDAKSGSSASITAFGDAIVWIVLEFSGVLIFSAAATLLLFAFWHNNEALRLFLLTYISAVAATLAGMAITELCLPRDWPARRLLPLSDVTTRKIKVFVLSLTIIWVLGFFSCHLIAISGAEPLPLMFLLNGVAALFCIVLIAFFSAIRGEIATLIRGPTGQADGGGYLRELFANSWHILASVYVLLVWILGVGQQLIAGKPVQGTTKGLLSLSLFFAVPVINIVIGRYLRARLGKHSGLVNAIRNTLHVILIVAGAAIFLSLWGLEVRRLEAAGVAGWLIRAAIDVGVVALIGYAVWQLMHAYFDSLLQPERTVAGADTSALPTGDGGGSASATRAATLLPLLRSFAMAAIVVLATLTALAGLGVEIGPLLAGAGVIGIALGFGAQTLVRDVVSGIFFLIDDAFRAGEYIDAGSAKGTVEKISVRSLRLRHHRGALQTVPFGEIKQLANYSRDWVIMKLPLRLTLDADPQQVKSIIKRIGAEMAADELLGPTLLQPPKSSGVAQVEDSTMIFSVKFMAKPQEQFVLRRELLHRIRAAFAEAGIKFGNREVTVHIDRRESDTDAIEKSAAAAARSTLDRELVR